MGGPVGADSYKSEHKLLGPCPLHLTTFDLTRHGMVASGHATQSLPQVMLEVRGEDVWAVGMMGLVFGYSQNPRA
jgi:arsenite oxidase small subunit